MTREEFNIYIKEHYSEGTYHIKAEPHLSICFINNGKEIIEWRDTTQVILRIVYPKPEDIPKNAIKNLLTLLDMDREITADELNQYKKFLKTTKQNQKTFNLNYYYIWKWGILDDITYTENIVPQLKQEQETIKNNINKTLTMDEFMNSPLTLFE